MIYESALPRPAHQPIPLYKIDFQPYHEPTKVEYLLQILYRWDILYCRSILMSHLSLCSKNSKRPMTVHLFIA